MQLLIALATIYRGEVSMGIRVLPERSIKVKGYAVSVFQQQLIPGIVSVF